MKGAPCTGHTRLFFPPGISEPSRVRYKREREAKLICNECPVLETCREYARRNDELGIWGGETETERWNAGFMRTNLAMKRIKAASESRRRKMARQAAELQRVD
jgi:hypothetical protein